MRNEDALALILQRPAPVHFLTSCQANAALTEALREIPAEMAAEYRARIVGALSGQSCVRDLEAIAEEARARGVAAAARRGSAS